MKKLLLSLIVFQFLYIGNLRADEGMWPLTLLSKIQDQMQARGLKLTAEDIYSINKSCVKDGVVRLMTKGNRMFCSGEIISDKGLFLTNHHCGYGAVQELSTPNDNILKNGFWAKNNAEEKPANFNIGLLARVEDVTDLVLAGINVNDAEDTRSKALSAQLMKVKGDLTKAEEAKGNKYLTEIMPFYNGNKFLAMYYEVFQDIRLVGVPPENIGKFGGETDNWMWPRHTSDFSMFRIYANADGKPAAYNGANLPLKPKFHFPISLKGTQPGDYAMIMGYPGRTTRYTYSEGIKFFTEKDRPMRVKLRRKVLDIYENYMFASSDIKLMYADKYAGTSNYWKKFAGEIDGLKHLKIYDRRKSAEIEFEKWVKANGQEGKYGEVTSLYDEAYQLANKYIPYSIYLGEGLMNIQSFGFAIGFAQGYDSLLKNKKHAATLAQYKEMAGGIQEMFKEYYTPIEKDVCAAILNYFYTDLDREVIPESLTKLVKKFKYDYKKLAEYLFTKSIFTDSLRFKKFLLKPTAAALKNDPIFMIVYEYSNKLNKEFKPYYEKYASNLGRANRLFLSGLMEMNPEKLYTPDANGTMRLTYGRVLDYEGRDAVHFRHFTTGKGILEKYTPGDIEFDAPKKLIDLISQKNFGQYADADGLLHVCFLSDNDITGGNSGSPVINGNGELIGTAFDGNWEAISSDFAFEPELQRTISVDIRYTLFIVDKFGGASNIIDELTIIK